MPRSVTRTLGPLAAVLWVLTAPLQPTRAADQAYEELQERGLAASGRGEWAAAEKYLRLACFGFLDEVPQLASCLTHLAGAQGEAGHRDAFEDTVRRILEIERRYSAYSEAQIPAAARSRLEGWLEQWGDYSVLGRYPPFRAVADRLFESLIPTLPPEDQRLELSKKIEAEPANPRWLLLQARLETEAGNPDQALAALETLLLRQPSNVEARCLRSQLRADQGLCEEAAAEIEVCGGALREGFAEPALRCLVDLGDWPRARALLDALPSDSKKGGSFRRMEREVRRGLRRAAAEQPAPETEEAQQVAGGAEADGEPAAEPSTETGEPTPPEPTPEPVETAPAGALGQISTMIEELPSLKVDGRLQALAQARTIADQYPGSQKAQHLTAELAYRISRWPDVVTYYRRGGPDEDRPDLMFYFAVALYELDRREEAADALREALPWLQRTDFVTSYTEKILGQMP